METEMTTDTPRTDAVQFQPRPISMTIENEMLRALSRKLERELSAEIANRKKCCLDGNRISDELFDTQLKLNESKAEVAELNRLMIGWKQRATMSKMDLEASRAEVERLQASVKHWQDQCLTFQHAWESSQALLKFDLVNENGS